MCDDDRYREAFKTFDADNSGSINCAELEAVLKELGHPDEEATEMALAIMKECDKSGDSKISFDEFMAAVKK